MKNVLIPILILMASCTSTNNIGVVKDKRIGIFYKLRYKMNICHTHTGMTSFGNFEKKYKFDEDISKLVTEGYERGVLSTGNTPIVIKSGPNFSKLMTFSFWDVTPTLTPEGKETIKGMGSKYNIDYLMVPWGHRENLPEDLCLGISIMTGKNVYSSPYIPVYIALVFNTNTGEYIGNTQISNSVHHSNFEPPKDIKTISRGEIERYVNYTSIASEIAVKKFLMGDQSGL